MNVYRNLNKKGVWYSLKDKNKVVGYTQQICLENVRFKHATSSQLQQIRAKHKFVCSWVSGTPIADIPTREWKRFKCDPKHYDCFQDANTFEKLDTARYVLLNQEGAFYETK